MKVKNLCVKIVSVITLIYFVPLCVMAQDHQVMFEEANAAMLQKNYSKALLAYKSILEKDFHAAALHNNIGQAYYHLDSLGLAILHFEKSLQLNKSEEVLQNLALAQADIDSDIYEIEPFVLKVIWQRFYSAIPVRVWLFLSGILLSAGLYLFWKNILIDKQSNQRSLITVLGLICVGLLCVAAGYAHNNHHERYQVGILIKPSTLHIAPDVRSDTLQNLSEGIKLNIEDKVGDWIKVELLNRDEGWLQDEFVGKI